MSNTTAFVLGNGESRKGIKIADLQKHGKVYACNAVYRTETPDFLVAVDPKMIIEICETDYPKNNSVWSNYNHQYDKISTAINHVQWFKPSLGWSSGPTALKLACDHGHTDIYILGFDYQGHARNQSNTSFSFNNVFKDSRNYKRTTDEATFYGNWMNQTKKILNDYPKVTFKRVVPDNWFKPKDLEFNGNFSNVTVLEFLSQYNLEIKL